MSDTIRFSFSHFAADLVDRFDYMMLHRGRGKGGSYQLVPVQDDDVFEPSARIGMIDTSDHPVVTLDVPIGKQTKRNALDLEAMCEPGKYHAVPDYDIHFDRWVIRLKEVRRAPDGGYLTKASDIEVKVI